MKPKRSVFSKNLKTVREKYGISQETLSEYLGLSCSCVTNFENGLREPTMGELIKLSDFFHVSVDDLIRGSKSEIIKLKDCEVTI